MSISRSLLLLFFCSMTVNAENDDVGKAFETLVEYQNSQALTALSYETSLQITGLSVVQHHLEKGEIEKAEEFIHWTILSFAKQMIEAIEQNKEYPLVQNSYIKSINELRPYIIKASENLRPEELNESPVLKRTVDYINANNPIPEVPKEIIESRKLEFHKAAETILKKFENLDGKI